MMLPEHLKHLQEWNDSQSLTKMPELTDWQLEELQQQLECILKSRGQVMIQTWGNGKTMVYEGIVKQVSMRTGTSCLEIVNMDGMLKSIPLCSVYNIRLVADDLC